MHANPSIARLIGAFALASMLSVAHAARADGVGPSQRLPPVVPAQALLPAPLDAPTPDDGSDLNAPADVAAEEARQQSFFAAPRGPLDEWFKPDAVDRPRVRLNGLLQIDSGFFSQDANSLATLGDIQNGTDLRRARIIASGYAAEFTHYWLEMDFGSVGFGRPTFMDLWLEQANLPLVGTIRVGQFRQPVTMDSWTNVRHLDFLERSAAFDAFDPFRRVGAMAYRNSDDELSLVACSVYATGFTFFNGVDTTYSTLGGNNPFGTMISDQGGVSFAARATHLLYYDEPTAGRYLLHVGGGYNFSEIGGGGSSGAYARTYQARSIPEFFVGDPTPQLNTVNGTPAVVDSGRFLANNYQLAHLELAGNHGSAHFQAEYLASFVQQMDGPTVFYDGAYLQAGYFLTGESAGYNKQAGVMDYNVRPFSDFFSLGRGHRGFCGWGAWEVAARWSYVNLSARNILPANQTGFGTPGPPPSPNPGVLNESTLAINWWWNELTRIEFNWIHSMLDNNARGFSALDIFAVRAQVEF